MNALAQSSDWPHDMSPQEFLALGIAWGEWRDRAAQRYGFRKVFTPRRDARETSKHGGRG